MLVASSGFPFPGRMSELSHSVPSSGRPTRADNPGRADSLAALVARMAQGHQEALAELYDQTSPVLNGLLLRMLGPEDAEEILLDVYMRAWKKSASFAPDRGTVQSWLVIMARTMAIDRIRQKHIHPESGAFELDHVAGLISSDASPEVQTEDARRRKQVAAILRELPAEQREVLQLAFFSGFTHSELAARLGQPLGTVKSRIRVALGRLRAMLEGVAA